MGIQGFESPVLDEPGLPDTALVAMTTRRSDHSRCRCTRDDDDDDDVHNDDDECSDDDDCSSGDDDEDDDDDDDDDRRTCRLAVVKALL